METIMLDSSVWISFFAEDCHTPEAKRILSRIESGEDIILIPSIIYAEIINNLTKLDKTLKSVSVAEIAFKNIKIKFMNPDRKFWFKKLKHYSLKVQLKTMDLAILAIAFEYKVNQLYSFDIKLQKAYEYLRNHYE